MSSGRANAVQCAEQKPSCHACVRRRVECIYAVKDHAGSRPPVTEVSVSSPPRPDSACSRLPSREAPPAFQTAPPPPQGQGAEPSPAETSARSPGGVSTVSAASCPRRTAPTPPPPSTFSIGDLALLHHWTLSTSLSICREASCADLWQRVLPEVGFEHPFVAHALLGLAALHLAHDGSSGADAANVARAAAHYNEAILGFRQAVADITPANSEALFIWSLLSVVYVFGFLTQRSDAAPESGSGASSHVSRRKELVLGIEWIPMLRGIEAVLGPTYNHLRLGRMQVIMSLGNWDELEPPVASAAAGGPDGYLCRARETWRDSGDAETYERALQLLRKCCVFIAQFDTMDAAALATWGYNRAWSGPLMFVHFAPEKYFTLLHQRQPPALVLFAYFGALLHGITGYWFMRGLGKEIVDVVGDLLGSYWRPWIAWPLDVVGPG